MKLNTSFLATSCQKVIRVDDERKLHTLYEKHMATQVSAEALGGEYDCVVQISDGNGKLGFTFKQNILTQSRVHLLLNNIVVIDQGELGVGVQVC